MRAMRRKDRQRDEAFCLQLIDSCTNGVMALTTGEDTPYCLPLSFVRKDKSLYFHGAKDGRKTDLLRACPKVCITFIGKDDPTYQEHSNNFTTMFASAIVTGTAHEVTESEEKIEALRILCQRFLPSAMTGDNFERALAESLKVTAVWRIDMEHISGKSK